jgi:BASS family bile acid:Na+ symporter
MGMTLTVDDFKRVATQPKYVLIGFLAQYMIMPLSAFFIAKAAGLGPALSSGLILVGCSPGGTASNLVTLIAQADVALSVVMTACSTVAAVFMTPWLTTQLAGSYVAIKAKDLVLSTLQVVLVPVTAGLVINTK